MLVVISGASGAGKSAVLPGLTARAPDVTWHEFDSVGVPPDANTAWRQRTLGEWIERARDRQAANGVLGLCGQVAYGEVLASPAAISLHGIAFCHLDCGDIERIRRLRARKSRVEQDTLNWAAWLRVHCVDPAWRPDVIIDGGWRSSEWKRWSGWRAGDPRWMVHCIDTTYLKIDEVADRVAAWVIRERRRPNNPVAVAA